MHDDLGYQDEFPLGFRRVVGDLDTLITTHGSVEAYLESVASTATTTAGGSETLDMYVGERGAGSATQQELQELSDDELRERAEGAARESPTQTTRETTQYSRSSLIKEYARRRAAGVCEACQEPAPFETKTGEPYLEVHHLEELSDEGPDGPDKVAAICPNCHQRIHYGADGNEYNQRLADSLGVSV